MGNFDTQMNEATVSFANELVELITTQVIAETAKALELEVESVKTVRSARKVERESKALVVQARRVKRAVRQASGTVEERILKYLTNGRIRRSVDIASDLDLLHPSTRRSLQVLETRRQVRRMDDGWQRTA